MKKKYTRRQTGLEGDGTGLIPSSLNISALDSDPESREDFKAVGLLISRASLGIKGELWVIPDSYSSACD